MIVMTAVPPRDREGLIGLWAGWFQTVCVLGENDDVPLSSSSMQKSHNFESGPGPTEKGWDFPNKKDHTRLDDNTAPLLNPTLGPLRALFAGWRTKHFLRTD